MAIKTVQCDPTQSTACCSLAVSMLEDFYDDLDRGRRHQAAISAVRNQIQIGDRGQRPLSMECLVQTTSTICGAASKGRMTLARGQMVGSALTFADGLGCRPEATYVVPGMFNMGPVGDWQRLRTRFGSTIVLTSYLACVVGVVQALGGGQSATLPGFFRDGQRMLEHRDVSGRLGHWI